MRTRQSTPAPSTRGAASGVSSSGSAPAATRVRSRAHRSTGSRPSDGHRCREIVEMPRQRNDMTNQIKTILLMGTLTALVVAFGAFVAPGQLYLFAAIALAMNLGAYFFSDRVVLRLHHARELNVADAPELHAIVDELARRAEIPKPRVYLIPEQQPNAFATGRNPARGVVA